MFLTIGVVCLYVVTAKAQVPKIQFEKNTHDFGAIDEAKGPVSYSFRFTNTGTAPLIVTAVNASCGCTTSGWTIEPVPPGKSGFVRAEYNPINRPGAFNKTLMVESNAADNPALVLYIKGNVNPKPRTPKDDYPEKLGSLRFKSRYFGMNIVRRDRPTRKTFKVMNEGSAPVTFFSRHEAPFYLKFEFSPGTLAPGKEGEITVEYDGSQRAEYGYVQDAVVLFTDEPDKAGRKEMVVAATLEDYFAPMTAEQYAQAPKLTLLRSFHDFGKLNDGEVVSTEFEYKNDGKQDLEIRYVRADCGCTAGTPEKKIVKPGEVSRVKLTFHSKGRIGKQTKSLTIYSNDPKNAKQVVTIASEVNAVP